MQLLIICFTYISNIVLGLMVYRNNPKKSVNRLLALITIIISLWLVANYLSLIGLDREFTLFWIRAVMFIVTPLGPLIYLFLKSFPDGSSQIPPSEFTFISAGIIIIGFLSFTPLVFRDVSLVNGIHPVPGVAIPLYGLFLAGYLFAGLRHILGKYKRSAGQVRLQMKYLIFGFFLTFILQLFSNYVLVVLLNISSLVVFGPVFSLILIGFVTYAIIKHRLMDIRFVLARTVSYTFLSVIIVSVYTTTIYLTGHFLFSSAVSKNQLLVSVFLSLIIAYTFQPLKHLLENKTDKFFFHDLYDPEDFLSRISTILATNIELKGLSQRILSELSATLKVENCGLIIKNFQDKNWQIISHNQNAATFSPEEYKLILKSHHKIIIFDDLHDGSLKSLMRKFSINLFVMAKTKGKLTAILFLQNKLSGDVFNSNDLEILEIIGPQLAIAIQNSQRYEEIKHFGQQMQHEVKIATDHLKQANQKLKELDKLKDDFVSVASHELRTPMTAIKSYLWMTLSGQGGTLKPKQKFYLQHSYDSTDRLIKLVNNMLNISRIESGRMSLDLAPVDLSPLAAEVVEEIAPRAKELGVNLSVSSIKLPSVIADADKIREVLFNLIGNSVKFTQKGGRVNVDFEITGNSITTHVIDNGTGLDKSGLANLFQKFGLVKGSFQTNKLSTQGTGLGLYICKQIIDLHQGKIWAVSPGLNRGTTFSFSLPISTPLLLKQFQKKYSHSSNIGIIHSKI